MSEERESAAVGAPGAEEALAALERGDESLVDGVGEEARAYLETLGSLPLALEPVEPPVRLRASILERARAAEARVPSVVETNPRSWPGAWMLRLAAVLAVVLAGVSTTQYFRLERQAERLATQAETISRLRDELRQTASLAGLAEDGLPEWMATSGTELCALKPREAASERTKGWLFVRQDHQHWYVSVEGLAPSPEGYVYELWFRVDGELVSGGVFHPDAEGRAALTSETMPNPVTGIAVTLEPDNGDGVPSERLVLWGDEVMVTL